MIVPTVVEILDSNLNAITQIRTLKPYDLEGNILQYSRELSYYGQCKFRISVKDRVFTDHGDIFKPHHNHVRIKKGTNVVWQGAIVNNPKRTKEYIEIVAFEYEFYLSRKLIKRTSPDINGTTDIYRIFSSGTMATAITAIINETVADYTASEHILSGMTVGTVENPNYPQGLISDYDGSALTGPWSFGDSSVGTKGPQLQFDYHTVLYVIRAFGMYSYADFDIDKDLKFNFKKFLGVRQQNVLTFSYGEQGNIIDYNAPRLGERMMNSVIAIATNPEGVIIHSNQSDQNSITSNGLLEGVAAYSDVKGQGILDTRSKAELPLVSVADETNITLYLNEHCYPLGMYDVGDLITVKIKDEGIDLNQVRRIVGITVIQHNTGRETISLQTNMPYPWQLTE